jgi:hypothetical protein
MLERRGLHGQAAHVRSLVVAEPAPPPERSPVGSDAADVTADVTSTELVAPKGPVLPFVPAGAAQEAGGPGPSSVPPFTPS